MDKPLRAREGSNLYLSGGSQAEEFKLETPSFQSEPRSNRWFQLDHKLFLMIVAIATVVGLVVIRSVYRTIELSDGW